MRHRVMNFQQNWYVLIYLFVFLWLRFETTVVEICYNCDHAIYTA